MMFSLRRCRPSYQNESKARFMPRKVARTQLTAFNFVFNRVFDEIHIELFLIEEFSDKILGCLKVFWVLEAL